MKIVLQPFFRHRRLRLDVLCNRRWRRYGDAIFTHAVKVHTDGITHAFLDFGLRRASCNAAEQIRCVR